jgi:hypothetical protein
VTRHSTIQAQSTSSFHAGIDREVIVCIVLHVIFYAFTMCGGFTCSKNALTALNILYIVSTHHTLLKILNVT